MSDFGHVEKVKAEVGGKVCNFRSKLEYRWSVWTQMRKELGMIDNWWYEDPDSLLEIHPGRYGNKKMYLPDFTILTNGEDYSFEETKGYFSGADYTKMKAVCETYDAPVTMIFANLKNTKSMRTQYNRAKKLEYLLDRLILDANETIFKPIKHLFQY